MATLNRRLVKDSKWKERAKRSIRQSLGYLVTPVTLEELYPTREKEVDGHFVEYKEILPHQRKLHSGTGFDGQFAKYILLNGGVGSGKSVSASCELAGLCLTYPGIRILVTAPFDWYFDTFILPTWHQVVGEDIDSPFLSRINVKTRTYDFVNGSQVFFRAFDDAGKVKGFECHVIWIEEASEICERDNAKAMGVWAALNMRLRAQDANGIKYPKRIYVTQNPSGHSWVWQIFVKDERDCPQPFGDYGRRVCPDPDACRKSLAANGTHARGDYFEYQKQKNGDVYYTISVPSHANTFLPVGYINSMLANMSKEEQGRMVEGGFAPLQEMIYTEPVYSERTHVIDIDNFCKAQELPITDPSRNYYTVEDIPSYWPVICGIDVGGQSSPWAAEFFVETPDEEMVAFDEIYGIFDTWDDFIRLIKVRMERWEELRFFIDPVSSNQHHGPNQDAITDYFNADGVPVEQPSHYRKTSAIIHVKSFLKPDTSRECPYAPDALKDDGQWEIGAARLYYLRSDQNEGENNERGFLTPFNIFEKRVWRKDNKKTNPYANGMDDLSPPKSEKIMDRDDHAQTAEMFAMLGWKPLKQGQKGIKPKDPVILYDGRRRR